MSAPPPPSLAAALARYALARLGMVAVVAALLVLTGVPLVIAVLVGLVVALPLSMLLLRAQRARLDEAVYATATRRGAEREALRARLRGDVEHAETSDEEPAEREPDAGRG